MTYIIDHVLSDARLNMIATVSESENMVDLILGLLLCVYYQVANTYPNPVFMWNMNCMPIKMQ